jgi:hypothetical protein
MARPFNRSFRTHAVVASPALAAETIIAQLTNVGTDGPTQAVLLQGWAAFTVGTTGTAVRLRLRADSLTGTLVADSGAVTGGIAAAALVQENVQGDDAPGDVDGKTYVMTLQVTGGSAASTVSAVSLFALVTD